MSIIKDDLGELVKLGILGDGFICAFLDESGIHKKPNYQKRIVELMESMQKQRDLGK